MNARAVTAASLRQHLERCGYTESRLACDYRFDGHSAPLVGFFGKPWDARSACVAAVDSNGDSRAAAATCSTLGAPTVLVCRGDGLDCWRMAADGPAEPKPVAANKIAGFFRVHRDDLSPESIYAVKTRRVTATQRQLRFVDAGLMPAVERNAGEALRRLVEGAIQDLTTALGGERRSKEAIGDLCKTVFWLLAAKLLNEKNVDKFKKIDLTDVDEVFSRVGRHYADIDELPPGGNAWRPAIDEVAGKIASWEYLGNISAEALGYLYEHALIDKKPKGARTKRLAEGRDIRKELGIHSTPPVLVDHMLAQVWPLIEQIAPADRHVFEPACGHAAFLVAALRLLREYAEIPEGIERHRYLRDHLYGIELEPFARELGKLSLTLADVPHGNSWRIDQKDMFEPNVLRNGAKQCTVLLANPPYEKFSAAEKACYYRVGEAVTANSKAVEMLARTLPHLPPGGVFGVVLPQGALHNRETTAIRKMLLAEFEISEIALFADNLFEEADHEAAIVLGRRRLTQRGLCEVRYRGVREKGMPAFQERLEFSTDELVDATRFEQSDQAVLRLPDLHAVWDAMRDYPSLKSVAKIGQGLFHKGRDLPKGAWTVHQPARRSDPLGYATVPPDLQIYEPPAPVGLNTDPSVVDRFVAGAAAGRPRVLFNYAPVSRGPWRLKAFVDPKGRAATSRFVVVTPTDVGISVLAVWALLNSPVANAFAYCHLMKRDLLVGTMRKVPIPTLEPRRYRTVEQTAAAYSQLATRKTQFMSVEPTDADIQAALLRVDAEVLKLYDLPPRVERQLLDLFQGVERKGVGCTFRGYYPPDLDAYVPLHELVSEEYARSTLDAFLQRHRPTQSETVLAALRTAAAAYGED